MIKTVTPGARFGEVKIPSSKSVVHRLMICAALGQREVEIQYDGLSRDIRATAECLNALGAQIRADEKRLHISPIMDRGEKGKAQLPAGESGSTLRFLIPVAGALGRSADFKMEGRLSERPLAPFDRLLREHGMTLTREGEILHCDGQLEGGLFRLPGNVSSQYFSGLLMALPVLRGESELQTEGEMESAAYVRLTEEVLNRANVRFERKSPETWKISGPQTPELPELVPAEGDWSNAAFFLCAAALSEKGIRVGGLNPASAQGDRQILEILRDFGAEVTEEKDRVTVRQGNRRPIDVNAMSIPDLVPVLAILCCSAEGTSRITGAARLRLKESDRLKTTTALIHSLGGEAEEHPDGIVIHGKGRLCGGSADAFNDHRIAMSAAVAAVLCDEPVIVSGAECVEKSYPAFWRDFEALNRTREPG